VNEIRRLRQPCAESSGGSSTPVRVCIEDDEVNDLHSNYDGDHDLENDLSSPASRGDRNCYECGDHDLENDPSSEGCRDAVVTTHDLENDLSFPASRDDRNCDECGDHDLENDLSS